jgi:F-type H+-transporting ATPase subunit a
MHTVRIWWLALVLSLGAAVGARAAEAPAGAAAQVEAAKDAAHEAAAAGEHGKHEGLPQAAPLLGPRQFVSSSMVVTWVVAAFLLIFSRRAMKNVKEVPEGAQNFWEWMVESLYEFIEGIIGPDLVKKTFWFFATIFIFILFANWAGLIPGVGTIGWGTPDASGNLHHIDKPLFRGVNADMNMTLAMAMIFFALWFIWALQVNGPGGFLMHIFGPKGDTTGFMKILMIGIFIIVGLLEVVTILFRPVTLSFRLYGNIFAGENMLEAMSNLVPALGWLIPIPFYFLELLVGLVQALVFMLLTAVFTLLICTHEEEGHGHGTEKAHAEKGH